MTAPACATSLAARPWSAARSAATPPTTPEAGCEPDEIANVDSSPVITSCDVQGGYPGNLDADPRFVRPVPDIDCCVEHETPGCEDAACAAIVCAADPFCCNVVWDGICADEAASLCGDLCALAAPDFRLRSGSPCIDAGDNTAVPEGITTDLDGNPRFVDDPDTADTGQGDPPVVDMGAYEFQGMPCPWDLDGNGFVGIVDLVVLLASWGPCDDPGACPADFDGSGFVGLLDLLALLAAWGPCP
jgi:hypothetical protein